MTIDDQDRLVNSMIGRNPKVSVIIPAFNAAEYLPETLESIFTQTYPDYEIILVDDGSTDETPEVASRYQGRIRYFRQNNSGGPARPRNVGIAQARGEFIAIFDSDDVMMPNKLARSVEFLRDHSDLGLIFTDFVKFDDHGTMPGTHMDAYENFWQLPKELVAPDRYRIKSCTAFDALFYGNYIGTSSVVAPAAVFKAIGPFDEEVTRGGLEDRDMWFRIARQHDIGFSDFVGHKYRVRSGSVSKRAIASSEARIKVLRRYVEPSMRAATRSQARSVIAECLYGIGYVHRVNGQLPAARRYFRQSFFQQPNQAALRGLLLALMGKRISGMLRFFKEQLGK